MLKFLDSNNYNYNKLDTTSNNACQVFSKVIKNDNLAL